MQNYAQQYTAFEDQRSRPARDLVAAIPNQTIATAIDLGCGPGNSTEILAQRFPNAKIIGLDNSADMIAAARQRLPHLQFSQGSIENWDDAGPFDVILANASLQWVPGHATLYACLVEKLNPGGSLAVQTPDNLEEPAHTLIREIANQSPWAAKLTTVARAPRHDADWYYALLHPLCSRVDTWRTTYYHPLPGGPAAIAQWFKGSALRPYLAQLTADEQADFIARYTQALATAYSPLDDGTILLPFPRLFLVAIR